MDKFFDHPGLCHIGEKIFKNLDFQTKLSCRLVRKSWNDKFEKQASKIDLLKMPNWSKFLNEPNWRVFLRKSKTEIPTLVLNFYLQNIFSKVLNSLEESYHRTPLSTFAISGNSKLVDFILDMKTVTTRNNECKEALNIHGTIFHHLAAKGHLEMLKKLCHTSSDGYSINPIQKNSLGRTPIHYAAAKGHLEVVKFLISYTSDPNASDKNGMTPSEYASSKGFLDIEFYLSNLWIMDE